MNDPAIFSARSRLWPLVTTVILDQKDRASYRREFREFCRFLGVEPGTQAASEKLLGVKLEHATLYREFLSRLMGEPTRGSVSPERIAPATLRKRLAIMRSFYRTFHNEGLIPTNPFAAIKAPSLSHMKRPTEMIPFEKIGELLNAPGNDSARAVRDTAIIYTLLTTGVRSSELERLTLADVRRDSEGIYFLYLRDTKNGDAAEQVLSETCASKVNTWKALRVEAGAKPGDPLFCTLASRGTGAQLHTRMSAGSPSRILKKYADQVGLDPRKFSAHSCRATAVSWLLAQKYDHAQVAQFSRHRSIEMVNRYDKRFFGRAQALGLKLNYEGEG